MKQLLTPITQGLSVTVADYELVAAGLAQHLPEETLTWEEFTDPARWWRVPDGTGDVYKNELVLAETAGRTVKVNWWGLPDRRGGAKPQPHNHPWPFRAHILAGGYTEDRYTADGGQVHTETAVEHRAGAVNTVPLAVFHEVTGIHDGGAVSLMVCERGERGTWGYLDLDTGQVLRPETDPGFTGRLRALNPHRF